MSLRLYSYDDNYFIMTPKSARKVPSIYSPEETLEKLSQDGRPRGSKSATLPPGPRWLCFLYLSVQVNNLVLVLYCCHGD